MSQRKTCSFWDCQRENIGKVEIFFVAIMGLLTQTTSKVNIRSRLRKSFLGSHKAKRSLMLMRVFMNKGHLCDVLFHSYNSIACFSTIISFLPPEVICSNCNSTMIEQKHIDFFTLFGTAAILSRHTTQKQIPLNC